MINEYPYFNIGAEYIGIGFPKVGRKISEA